MASQELSRALEFANLQMAAEAFLRRKDEAEVQDDQVKARLEAGNTHASKFMPAQAADFVSKYDVVAQYRNDQLEPSGTGFSGTLFRRKSDGELTLSFRSTEFIDDAVRDSKATNELEVKELGWALGQISEMERWYAQLSGSGGPLQGKLFNVTGYSLGGHLATAFNLLRQEEEATLGTPNPIIETYTFNGAGVGSFRDGATLKSVLGVFDELRFDHSSLRFLELSPETQTDTEVRAAKRVESILAERRRIERLEEVRFAFPAPPPTGDQASVDYQIAALVAGRSTVPVSSFPFPGGTNWIPTSPIFAPVRIQRMTEIVGSDAGRFGPSYVANSGMHYGERLEIYIESQPLTRGTYVLPVHRAKLISDPSRNDFADTHSLVLIVDSLSLMAAFESVDSSFTTEDGARLLAATSSQRSSEFPLTQGGAEGDVLERALDALRRMILGPGVAPTLPDDYAATLPGNTWHLASLRTPYHENLDVLSRRIAELNSGSASPLSVRLLGERSAAENAALAGGSGPEAMAYRYALRHLVPFAVVGLDYAQHNANGELNLHDGATGEGEMTAGWLRARADMLDALTRYNKRDGGADAGIKEYYEDQGLNLSLGPALPFGARIAFGRDTDDSLSGGAGIDRIFGRGGDDTLSGRAADDHIEGGFGNDTLLGEGGNDFLHGGEGDDWLVGGSGDDNIDGGIGFDTYVYDVGDGFDRIADADGRGSILYKGRTLTGGTQVSAGAYRDAHGTTYKLVSLGGDTTLVIDNAIYVSGFTSGALGITLAGPADPGSVESQPFLVYGGFPWPVGVDPAAPGWRLANALHYFGSNLDDRVTLDSPLESFTRSGRDTIAARQSSDLAFTTIDAGADDDIVDLTGIVGPLGRRVAGGAGNDSIHGGDGRDIINGDNYSLVLDPIVSGRFTLDWFKFNLAGVESRFIAESVHPSYPSYFASSGASVEMWDLVYGLNQFETEAGELANLIASEGWHMPRGAQDVIDYVLGRNPTFDDYIDAGGGNDTVNGGAGSDVIYGGAGDDLLIDDDDAFLSQARAAFGDALGALFGRPGDDYLDGGDGDDTLIAGAGNDILLGGAGNDILISHDRPAHAADASFDMVFGGEGDDQITTSGRVLADGGPGNDTYTMYTGIIRDTSGVDSLNNPVLDWMGTGLATAFFFMGITPGLFAPPPPPQAFDIEVTRSGDDLVFLNNTALRHGFPTAGPAPGGGPGFPGAPGGTAHLNEEQYLSRLVILGWFASESNRIEQIGGLTAAQFERWGSLHWGTSADDVYIGGDHTDRMVGGGGHDIISAGAGADLIMGGAGDDILDGGFGDDSYFYDAGDGSDIIVDAGGFDVLYLRFGIVPSDVSVGIEGSSIRLRIGAGSVLIHGATGDSDDERAIDRIVFLDGSALSVAGLVDMAAEVRGTAGDDYLRGGAAANEFRAGPGNDVLVGNAGVDVYHYDRGDGFDTIVDGGDPSERDAIQFGAGIEIADLGADVEGSVMYLSTGQDGDVLEIIGRIDEFRFASGETLSLAELLERVPRMTAPEAPDAGEGETPATSSPPLPEQPRVPEPEAVEAVRIPPVLVPIVGEVHEPPTKQSPVIAIDSGSPAVEAMRPAIRAFADDERERRPEGAAEGAGLAARQRDPEVVGVSSDPVYREIDARLDVLLQAGRANLSERYAEAVEEFERRRKAPEDALPAPEPEEMAMWNEAVHAWHAGNPGFETAAGDAADGIWGNAWSTIASSAPTLEQLVGAASPSIANPHALPRLGGAAAAPGLRDGISELRG